MQGFHQFIWYLTVFFVPLSVSMEIGGGISLSFPSEILIVVCGILGIFTQTPAAKSKLNLLRNPISYLIFAYIAILLLTTLTSVQPQISLKRFVITILFLWVFYFQAAHRFLVEKEIIRFWYCYIAGMTIALVYVLWQHAHYQFAANVSAEIPQPLFAEHAVYGACLAFVIPFLAIRWLNALQFGQRKWTWGLLFWLFLFAEFTAASRAAWIGLVASMGLFVLLFFRVKIGQFVLLSSFFLLLIGMYQADIGRYIAQNKAESHSKNGDITELLFSVTNVSTDVSNLERLNRWGAASRMIADKPISGFGLGTYPFHYADYQVFSEITRISTRNGNKGNAHSEYMMAWVETGFFGFCVFIALFGTAIYSGIKNIHILPAKKTKALQLAALLGLFTYMVLGIFNAFLDQDEAATLVWSAFAMIAAGIHARKATKA